MKKPTKRAPQKAAGTERPPVNKWFQYIKRDWSDHPLFEQLNEQWLSEGLGAYSNDPLWLEAIAQSESGNPAPLIERLAAGKPMSPWVRPRVERATAKKKPGRPPTPVYSQSVLDEWLEHIAAHVEYLRHKQGLSLTVAIEEVATLWSSKPHTLQQALTSFRGQNRGSTNRHRRKVRAALKK